MRKTKSIALIIILLVFGMSYISYAQDDQTKTEKKYKCTPEEAAKKYTDRMKDKLSLTDDQYNKILKLQTDRITYFRELREKDIISKSEIKKKRQEFKDGMKNILTDEQMQKMKKGKRNKNRKNRW